MKRRSISGDEQDVHSRWRHMLVWTQRAGATDRVKRESRRRERREGQAETLGEYLDYANPVEPEGVDDECE